MSIVSPSTREAVPRAPARQRKLPIEPKIALTVFVAILVPVYWVAPDYGPVNFLWACDTALLVTVVALWLENRFLASMQLLAIAAVQTLWTIDYLGHLILGFCPMGFASYAFSHSSILLHVLTLFHAWLPWLLLYVVWRMGYDRRVFFVQLLAAYVTGWICFFFTDPAKNINFVHGAFGLVPDVFSPVAYMFVTKSLYPIVFLLPYHLLLVRFCEKPADKRRAQGDDAHPSVAARIARLFWVRSPRKHGDAENSLRV